MKNFSLTAFFWNCVVLTPVFKPKICFEFIVLVGREGKGLISSFCVWTTLPPQHLLKSSCFFVGLPQHLSDSMWPGVLLCLQFCFLELRCPPSLRPIVHSISCRFKVWFYYLLTYGKWGYNFFTIFNTFFFSPFPLLPYI